MINVYQNVPSSVFTSLYLFDKLIVMILDAHYHLVPALESVERLLSETKRCGIGKVILISALSEPFRIGKFAEKMSSLMRKCLLSNRARRLGLFMYQTTVTESGKFSILGKTYQIIDEPNNDEVEKVIDAHPDRFLGWITVNPARGMGIEEIEKRLKNKDKWVGVKVHPFWHRYSVSMLEEIAAYCCERDLPVLIHLGGSKGRGDYRFLPEKYPSLKIIFAHAGVPFYRELWDYIKTKDNLYVDLSSPYLDEALRRYAIECLGADKCIYGSDGPFGYYDRNGEYEHMTIIEEIRRSGVKDSQLERIFYRNMVEIIGRDNL